MSQNIKYQLLRVIDRAFRYGGKDKHADKAKGVRLRHVYGYSERKNLIDTSALLAKYITTKYPTVKKLKEITGDMVQEFLNSCTQTCDQETLEQYFHRIHKLQHLASKTYGIDVNWKTDVIVPNSEKCAGKRRNVAMNPEHLKKILEYCYQQQTKSKSVIAIEFAARFALRVSDTCKVIPLDIRFDEMQLHIHESKGKRNRDIQIKNEDKEYLRRVIDGLPENERIVSIEEDSVNRYLARMEKKLGFREEYKNAVTGIHSIRKLAAQRLYDEFRNKGMSRNDAIDCVSEYLGHNRHSVVKDYVNNIW